MERKLQAGQFKSNMIGVYHFPAQPKREGEKHVSSQQQILLPGLFSK